MVKLAGIEGGSRAMLAQVLRNAKPIFNVAEAGEVLGLPNSPVAKMLARWVKQGWLIRVRRNAYMAVPPEARSPEDVAEDPYIVGTRLYDPSYFGGWTAAEQWGFTEQIFRTIVVLTTGRVNSRRSRIRSTDFLVRTISPAQFFGTKTIWRENVKLKFSDPTKTLVDMLNDPFLAGGARMLQQILGAYLSSNDRNTEFLVDYGQRMGNGAIFKRLGFLLEQTNSNDNELLALLKQKLTTGNAKLDPALECRRLVTRWRLLIPDNWGNQNR